MFRKDFSGSENASGLEDEGMSNAECEFGLFPLQDITWLASALEVFQSTYSYFHPYVVVALCVAGVIMNVVTMVVLLKPSMVSPVAVLLFSVAACDLLVMVSYLVFVLHFLIIAPGRCQASDYSFLWAMFMMLHAHSSVIFHASSLWLTVILSLIRIATLTHKKKGRKMVVTIRFTVLLSVITCLVMLCINIPNILTFKIVEIDAASYLACLTPSEDAVARQLGVRDNQSKELQPEENQKVFMVVASRDDCRQLKFAFWTNGLCFKVFPCLLLTISIILLVKIITGVARKRRSLAKVLKRRKMPRDRISPILIVVLAIFLVTELPQGIMLVLTGIIANRNFHYQVYLPLGDFMDLLSMINSAVNFVIYCSMSRKFREVLLQMFKQRLPLGSPRAFDEMYTVGNRQKDRRYSRYYSEDINGERSLRPEAQRSDRLLPVVYEMSRRSSHRTSERIIEEPSSMDHRSLTKGAN